MERYDVFKEAIEAVEEYLNALKNKDDFRIGFYGEEVKYQIDKINGVCE